MWMQIVAFIVSMTGTVMLLYSDPDISTQIWNCFLILASNVGAALFKVNTNNDRPTTYRQSSSSYGRLGRFLALFFPVD